MLLLLVAALDVSLVFIIVIINFLANIDDGWILGCMSCREPFEPDDAAAATSSAETAAAIAALHRSLLILPLPPLPLPLLRLGAALTVVEAVENEHG